ncbi:cytochrome c maturation protein CcmE [Pseudoflavitalea sp. G-6-1-2]|uniref:cytochrome c maturation protein CcmE domain-containing protein n=1 Tax=Pseudoflavitalea sp. G-6-1-2 TaxID=2728841 RepID=UPI00146E76D9|nr:cytochrome c maturation protein CcmE [Pseudoflavitalea sp. G-6-1-2]NML23717.1 cytochrome c maturation protein CcmE [Pseudoflavitalea sp. G-6-1-2]
MKKTHVVILVAIAAGIMILLSFMGDLSTYETLASARQKEGKTVTVITQLDKSVPVPIEYDAVKNPNLTKFHVVDSLGNKAQVMYYFEKPMDMEKSDRIVLKGKMKGDVFEISRKDGILIKCPSKYKDDPKAAYNNLTTKS